MPRPPSVDALARSIADVGLPHPLLVDAARRAVAEGDPAAARALAVEMADALQQPVVNATGVLLHTNLGRSPLAYRHDERPSTVELDLATGQRGRRGRSAALLIRRLAGADAALIVNNGAAAVLLALTALASGRTVVVSRGELVEIGGGFRIPEVLAQSGAHLVEVGTTNRTRLADYATAVARDDPALILKVHQSNYRMVGFTEATDVAELATLGVPVIADIGSGLLDARTPWLDGGPPSWLAGEPAARQVLSGGAGLVTFSGDKLLGGPQAGIIAGSPLLVERCAAHPLARAVRPGALVLGALEQALLALLSRDLQRLPFWQMATADLHGLRRRAEQVARSAGSGARVVDCRSAVGGGSLPGIDIPSVAVALDGDRTAELRRHKLPVLSIARHGHTLCDLRSVAPGDDEVVADAVRAAVATRHGSGAP